MGFSQISSSYFTSSNREWYAVHDLFCIATEFGKFNSSKLMARLDAENLFENIPLEESMENIMIFIN